MQLIKKQQLMIVDKIQKNLSGQNQIFLNNLLTFTETVFIIIIR